jgi:hypothetical protein
LLECLDISCLYSLSGLRNLSSQRGFSLGGSLCGLGGLGDL